ncbi:hypothetical protein AB0I68_37640 [Streptomyces sp. NPDC050448]|uniref:hypothetical protein n=1 Tax=Streptomyces sp. NPDC050448 TaxID=3155404 RepID=UPI003447E73C
MGDDTVRTRADLDVERAARLLRHVHSALDLTLRVLSSSTVEGLEHTMADFGRTLRGLRDGSDGLATAALGIPPHETDSACVLTALYVSEDVGRIGVLLEQAGEVAQLRSSGLPLAEEALVPVRDLGGAALRLVALAHDVVRSTAPPTVMDRDLSDIATRQRDLERLLMTGDEAPGVLSDAADAAVLGRCFEECASRAAAVARIGALRRRGHR